MKTRNSVTTVGFVLSFSLSIGGCGNDSGGNAAGYSGVSSLSAGTGGTIGKTGDSVTGIGGQSTNTPAGGNSGSARKTGQGGKTVTSTGGTSAPKAGTGGADAGSKNDGGTAATAGKGGSSDGINVAQEGPYKFDKYTNGVENAAYGSAIVYYPTDAPPPYGAVVFSPGFTATKESYENFLGPLFASHGIVMMLTTPTTVGDLPIQRSEDLQAAAEQILAENDREGSPLKGKMAGGNSVCVSGHSMGGGGTMMAAAAMGDSIKCAIGYQPWNPGSTYAQITAPTLFIAGQADTIAAPAANAHVFYASIPETVPKYYAEVEGASHFLTSNDMGTHYDTQSKYIIAFAKTYLDGDDRYLSILNEAKDANLSAYEHVP